MDFISQLCSVYWRVAHESCETLAISLEKKGLKKKGQLGRFPFQDSRQNPPKVRDEMVKFTPHL